MKPAGTSALEDAYLSRRADLLRYFSARLGSAEAAEDLVQDIWLKIERGVEGEVTNPSGFLFRLGSNLMLDRIKQQRRARARDASWRSSQSDEIGGEDLAAEPAADQATAARQHLERLIAALNDLTPACRRVFRMHKLEGLSHAETAAALGISRSAVEKHVSAALKHLTATVGRWP